MQRLAQREQSIPKKVSTHKQKDSLIRGERTRFGRGENVSLHKLPSAQAHEPMIVRASTHRSFTRHCFRFLTFFGLIAGGLLLLVYYVIESGSLDRFLADKANEQIAAAMPEGYHARIETARLRLSHGHERSHPQRGR